MNSKMKLVLGVLTALAMLLATFAVVAAACTVVSPEQVITIWGSGFWELLPTRSQFQGEAAHVAHI